MIQIDIVEWLIMANDSLPPVMDFWNSPNDLRLFISPAAKLHGLRCRNIAIGFEETSSDLPFTSGAGHSTGCYKNLENKLAGMSHV